MGRKFIYITNINIYHIECTYHQEGNFKQVSEEENQIAFMLDKIIPTCWNLVLHSLCPTYWYLTANHPPTAVSWEDSPAMRKNASYQKTLHFWCDVSHKQCAGENLHICQGCYHWSWSWKRFITWIEFTETRVSTASTSTANSHILWQRPS